MNRVVMIAVGLASCIGVLACAPTPPASAPPGASADMTRVTNARVYTMDYARPIAEAMVIDADGRIVEVGGAIALKSDYPDAAEVDLGQATVVPGLIDAHGHLLNLGLALQYADLVGTQSKAEVIQRLKQAERKLGPEDWLLGRGWDQNDWPGQTYPTAADLDAAFPDRPVWVTRIDGHAAWANSAALARVTEDLSGSWQPDGGRILRDEDGQPTGVFIDNAEALVQARVPPPSPAFLRRAVRAALRTTVSQGLTGVHEAGVGLDQLEMYRSLSAAGEFPLRLYAMAGGENDLMDAMCTDGAVMGNDGRVLARTVKLYADGALGSRGAALHRAYSDEPDNLGLLIQPADELERKAERVAACGLQLAIHAIGDRANTVTIDAIVAAQNQAHDNPGRHRIEHVQVIQRDDIARMAEHGIIASMQPTHATSDMPWAEDRLGEDRVYGSYAWRQMLNAGIPLALGSDFPVESSNPLLGFYAAVTRQDLQGQPQEGWRPEERLTRTEALHGFTLGAAYAAFMEDEVGSLQPGKRADFVVLSADLMEVPAAEIPEIKVLQTWLDGEKVHDAGSRPEALEP